MKKHGFTLAEVLVTLGIIGVISALVMPTFTSSMQNRKIGPKLAKAVASFEMAAQASLADAEASRMTEAGWTTPNEILNGISTHLKGQVNENTRTFTSSDGVGYRFLDNALVVEAGNNPPHMLGLTHRGGQNKAFIIDIDGFDNGQNSAGIDRFYFTLMQDGSLVPWGSRRNFPNSNENTYWDTASCMRGSSVTNTAADQRGRFCTAHVLENNQKVEYTIVNNQ